MKKARAMLDVRTREMVVRRRILLTPVVLLLATLRIALP